MARKKQAKPEAKEKPEVCGHRNMHFTEGVLTCQLPKGHACEHFGSYNDTQSFWTDAAGKPTGRTHG